MKWNEKIQLTRVISIKTESSWFFVNTPVTVFIELSCFGVRENFPIIWSALIWSWVTSWGYWDIAYCGPRRQMALDTTQIRCEVETPLLCDTFRILHCIESGHVMSQSGRYKMCCKTSLLLKLQALFLT